MANIFNRDERYPGEAIRRSIRFREGGGQAESLGRCYRSCFDRADDFALSVHGEAHSSVQYPFPFGVSSLAILSLLGETIT